MRLFFFAVYDALTGEIVRKLTNHNACVRDVSWHPYMNEIVSSSWDRRIVKWTPNPPEDETSKEGKIYGEPHKRFRDPF